MPPSPSAPATAARGSAPIRVMIVDDQHLIRAGFGMLIDSQPDLRIVGEAADGAAAISLQEEVRADVVLMDVRMPGMDGIEATDRITRADRGNAPGDNAVRVIVLTAFDLDEYPLAAIRSGASGFLPKDAKPEEMLSAIGTVARGDAVIAPSTTRRLLEHLVVPPAAVAGSDEQPRASEARHPTLARLTSRERVVLEHIARRASNQEIAVTLFLSEATVKTDVGRILGKLGVRDRMQAVVLAYEAPIVHPNG